MLRWAEHVASMGESIQSFCVEVSWIMSTWRQRMIWEGNIKVDLGHLSCEDAYWMKLNNSRCYFRVGYRGQAVSTRHLEVTSDING